MINTTYWLGAIGLLMCGCPASAQAQPPPTAAPAAPAWVDPDKTAPPGMRYETFHSRTIDGPVSYLIYLPPDYDKDATTRYPVVYWLHGMGGSQKAAAGFVKRLDPAIRAGRAPAMIVVGVNGLRASNYCDSFDGQHPVESVIVRDLIPHVDKTYRTIVRREGRGVEGFSMGGLGAAYLGFKYPKLFGVVSILAGALHDADSIAGGGDPRDYGVSPEGRKALFQSIYGGKREYFQTHNAWAVLEKNAGAIRDRTAVRIVVGDEDPLRGPNRRYHELLDLLKIQHTFALVAGARHSYDQVMERSTGDPLEFYVTAFAATPGRKAP